MRRRSRRFGNVDAVSVITDKISNARVVRSSPRRWCARDSRRGHRRNRGPEEFRSEIARDFYYKATCKLALTRR
jgi:hypothetical protein